MRILIIYRTKNDDVGKFVTNLKINLEKNGNIVDLYSRNEDLHMSSLSSSMEGIKDFVKWKDLENKYDLIYTQDWSIAFPLLFPSKVAYKKHYSLFHNIQEDGNSTSKILSKIAANMLGDHLFVRNQDLKKIFSRSSLSEDGMKILDVAKN